MGGMLFIGVMVAFFAGLGGMLFNLPMLNLVVSGAFALLSSAMILYHTSLIIHGGERNYIVATLSIYIALFNLFMSLLRIFAFLAGNRE
jgi:modulator of FtsH protease